MMSPALRPRIIRAACLWSLLAMPWFVTGCSEDAPAQTPLITTLPQAAWTTCATDDACHARWLPCRGWRAINREHSSEVEAWYAQANRAYLSRADCDVLPGAAPVAFCRAKQCTLE